MFHSDSLVNQVRWRSKSSSCVWYEKIWSHEVKTWRGWQGKLPSRKADRTRIQFRERMSHPDWRGIMCFCFWCPYLFNSITISRWAMENVIQTSMALDKSQKEGKEKGTVTRKVLGSQESRSDYYADLPILTRLTPLSTHSSDHSLVVKHFQSENIFPSPFRVVSSTL